MHQISLPPNTLAHFAINADDVERGKRFYERAFGWNVQPWGPPKFFTIRYENDDRIVGALQGRRQLVDGVRNIGYECTLKVDDLQETIRRITQAGGTIVMQPVVIPTVGELAFFADTEGNVAGVMEYGKQ